MELLVHSGANTGLTSVYGQSCASLARDRGDTAVLDVIRNGVPESYDPNKTIILVKTMKGIVKRRRKRKKQKKEKKESEDGESKLSNDLLSPPPANDDLPSSKLSLEVAMKADEDDSGIEDVHSDADADAEIEAESEEEDEISQRKKK